jgi:acetyltransferase-like isoleucine patch superfamily enzyme
MKQGFSSLVAKLVRRMGRIGFAFDPKATGFDLLVILTHKLMSLTRFQLQRPWLGRSAAFNFAEKNVSIRSAARVRIGKGCYFGRDLEIDALSRHGISIGNNVTIKSGGIINCTGVLAEFGEGLTIEDNVGISERCYIQVRGPVRICEGAILGPNVSIFSENHRFDDPTIDVRLQGVSRNGVTLGPGSWIGAGVTILDGVLIGKNSVVAAGAVVVGDVPDGAIFGGIPARRLNKGETE